jgi:hypothetical protein
VAACFYAAAAFINAANYRHRAGLTLLQLGAPLKTAPSNKRSHSQSHNRQRLRAQQATPLTRRFASRGAPSHGHSAGLAGSLQAVISAKHTGVRHLNARIKAQKHFIQEIMEQF